LSNNNYRSIFKRGSFDWFCIQISMDLLGLI
jgi:hypothetical protein